MVGNGHMEVVGLELPLVLEGMQHLLTLPSLVLGKAWSNKDDLSFLKAVQTLWVLQISLTQVSAGVFSMMSLSLA